MIESEVPAGEDERPPPLFCFEVAVIQAIGVWTPRSGLKLVGRLSLADNAAEPAGEASAENMF